MKYCEKYNAPLFHDEYEREKDWKCADAEVLIPESYEKLEIDEDLKKELKKVRDYVVQRKSRVLAMLRLVYQGKNLYDLTDMCKWKTTLRILFLLAVVFPDDRELIDTVIDIYKAVTRFPSNERDEYRVYDFRAVAAGMLIALQIFIRGKEGVICDIEHFRWHITDFMNFIHEQDSIEP